MRRGVEEEDVCLTEEVGSPAVELEGAALAVWTEEVSADGVRLWSQRLCDDIGSERASGRGARRCRWRLVVKN